MIKGQPEQVSSKPAGEPEVKVLTIGRARANRETRRVTAFALMAPRRCASRADKLR